MPENNAKLFLIMTASALNFVALFLCMGFMQRDPRESVLIFCSALFCLYFSRYIILAV